MNDDLLVLLTILYIAGAVLGIVLFIKVWIMTNNVRKIKEHLLSDCGAYSFNVIRREIKKKSPNIESILFDALWRDLESIYYKSDSEKPNFRPTIEYYKKHYEKAGVPFPEEVDSIENIYDYKRFSLRQ